MQTENLPVMCSTMGGLQNKWPKLERRAHHAEELPRTTVWKRLPRKGTFLPPLISNSGRVPRTITEGDPDVQKWRNNYAEFPVSASNTGRRVPRIRMKRIPSMKMER